MQGLSDSFHELNKRRPQKRFSRRIVTIGAIGLAVLAMLSFLGSVRAANDRPQTEHTVPLTVKRQGPSVFLGVDVVINGFGPYDFMIDTDNSFSEGKLLVSSVLADKLSLPVSTSDDSETVTINSLTVAGYDMTELSAASVDMTEFVKGPPDGILPLSFLSDFVVTLDLPNREMTMGHQPVKTDGEGVLSLSFGEFGEPMVSVVVGQHRVLAAISLSTRTFVNMPAAYQDSLSLKSVPMRIGLVGNSDGEFEILGARFQGVLHVGSHDISVENVRFSEAFKRPEIGFRALENFAITIDQGGGRAVFVLTDARVDVHAHAAAVENLVEGKPRLRDAFNAEPEKVRLILILSPT